MINLLYHSHTIVPAHLEEIANLDLLDPDEQVLVAVDGVLLDGQGQRLSGPTLHDYCLITDLRVVLWARDYGRHLCYAFPLSELTMLDGAGVDPIHGALTLGFSSAEAEEQIFTLTLMAQAHMPAILTLLRTAAETARAAQAAGVSARRAGPDVATALGAAIYGAEDALRPGEMPYRWPGGAPREALSPRAPFTVDPTNLPPNQIFTAGRFARSAWDTLRRSLREADLPFDLSSGSVREFTEAIRAVNDLVQSVTTNPSAQQLAMAFINRQPAGRPAEPAPQAPPPAATSPFAPFMAAATPEAAPAAPAPSSYHEIPLRRRGTPPPSASPRREPAPPPPSASPRREPAPPPDRREIPLRRRATPPPARPAAISGSGDADIDHGA